MRKLILFLFAALLLAVCSAQGKVPVIGISSGFNGSKSTLSDSYVCAVRKAGGVPVILPLVRNEAQAKALMKTIDGLILSGGEDINPAYYGEEILNESVEINAVRDTSDFLLVQAARNCAKPIMGICRGHQIINIALGGTLYQDLPSELGVIHRQKEPSSVPTHKVGLAKDSRIRKIMGVDSLMTNTHHHQAIENIAPGLKVTARAADGVIEGCEGKGVFCVQFHPEGLIKGGDDSFLPIFQSFIKECR